MAVSDELRIIADRAGRELHDIHDYFEHSRFAWQAVETLVAEGRPTSLQNDTTGTTVDGAGLVARTPRYIITYLSAFTFRHAVSIFEVFLFDFLDSLLMHNPWQFADRHVEVRTVLEAGSRQDILSAIVRKQLNELKYDQLREWFLAINRAVRLDCPSDDELETLAEIKAARDILEHNAGIVNELYLRKSGRKARWAAGDRIEIAAAYRLDSWALIQKVVGDIATAAITRLSRP